MKLPKFKGRASGNGALCTQPRSKAAKEAGELSATTKSIVENWAKEKVYERRKELTSKYVVKGNQQEAGAIQLAADYFGWVMAEKNEVYLEDEFFTGTPDVILGDTIADIKCSFDAFTFPLFETDLPKKFDGYDAQLQTYCHLASQHFGRKFKFGKLVFVLMDAPEHLIESEARKRAYAIGENEVSTELFERVRADMTYSHLPLELRIKSFDIDADIFAVNKMSEQVVICRQYIERELQPKLKGVDLHRAKTENFVKAYDGRLEQILPLAQYRRPSDASFAELSDFEFGLYLTELQKRQEEQGVADKEYAQQQNAKTGKLK